MFKFEIRKASWFFMIYKNIINRCLVAGSQKLEVSSTLESLGIQFSTQNSSSTLPSESFLQPLGLSEFPELPFPSELPEMEPPSELPGVPLSSLGQEMSTSRWQIIYIWVTFLMLSFREDGVAVKCGRKADNLKCDHCNVVFKVILLNA